MADINKSVNINIDSNANQVASDVEKINSATEKTVGSTKSLKSQYREAQAEVAQLAEKFGATSKEAVNAAKRAAELKDAIGDAIALTDAFNPDAKFKALSGSLVGVAGGFSAVQGAMGLFGAQSKDVEAALLKVNSAMALSQGLQGLGESVESFKNLGAVAKTALSGIRSGIAATGIGVLLVALGTIVAYWDDIKSAVSGVSSEQEKLNVQAKANLDAEQKKLDAISAQENTLKAQGLTERDILKLKIAQSDRVIFDTKLAIKRAEFEKETSIALAKRNQDILATTLKFISLPLTMILETVDAVGRALGKDFGLSDKVFKGLASFVFDPEAVKDEAGAAIQAQKDGITKLINDQDGFKNQVKAIDKQASDEKKAKTKEELDKEKERLDEKKAKTKEELDKEKERLDAIKALEKNNLKEIQDLKAKSEVDKVALEKQRALDELNALVGTAEEKAKAKQAIEDKDRILALDAEEADRQTRAEIEAEQEEIRTERRQFQLDKIREENALFIQAEEDLKNAKRNALEEGLNIFLSFAGKNKSIALGILAIQKGLAIADVITNASKSIATQTASTAQANAATNAFYSLAGPVGAVAAAAQIAKNNVLLAKGITTTKIGAATNIASIVAAGLQGAKSITASGASGGGGEGGGAGVSASARPAGNFQASSENQIASSVANQNRNGAPIKTYVVASEVSTQQSLDRNINNRSTL